MIASHPREWATADDHRPKTCCGRGGAAQSVQTAPRESTPRGRGDPTSWAHTRRSMAPGRSSDGRACITARVLRLRAESTPKRGKVPPPRSTGPYRNGWSHEEYFAAVLSRESVRVRIIRHDAADQSRLIPRREDPRGVRLRPPTLRRPHSPRPSGPITYLEEAKNVVLLGLSRNRDDAPRY